jgi:uncharacterized membrane protein
LFLLTLKFLHPIMALDEIESGLYLSLNRFFRMVWASTSKVVCSTDRSSSTVSGGGGGDGNGVGDDTFPDVVDGGK